MKFHHTKIVSIYDTDILIKLIDNLNNLSYTEYKYYDENDKFNSTIIINLSEIKSQDRLNEFKEQLNDIKINYELISVLKDFIATKTDSLIVSANA